MKNRTIRATTPPLRWRKKKNGVKVRNRRRGSHLYKALLPPPRIATIRRHQDPIIVANCPTPMLIDKIYSFELKRTRWLMLPCFTAIFCEQQAILPRNPACL